MLPIPQTNDEWATLISEVEGSVPEQQTPCPRPSAEHLAGYFDHTLLKLDAKSDDLEQLCAEAKRYLFKVWYSLQSFAAIPSVKLHV